MINWVYRVSAARETNVLHGVLEERVVALELRDLEHLRVDVQLHVHAAPLCHTRATQYSIHLVVRLFVIFNIYLLY